MIHKVNCSARKAGLICLIAVLIIAPAAIPARAAAQHLSDLSISDAVEDELNMDSAVPAYLIDVAARDGIVTLTGSVDNILAQKRAARIAESVKGVRGVVNRIDVYSLVLRTDGQIREDVQEALLDDPATDSFEVAVKVADNVVTLSGKVDSWQEKALCRKVAEGVKGVKKVNNQITVSATSPRPDIEIQREIEKVLDWDVRVDDALMDVVVQAGDVTLSGIAGSAAEKRRAVLDAHVRGVKSVDAAGLEVKRWARDADLKGGKYEPKSDKQIESALKDALLYDPRVSLFDVAPAVHDGKVTLRGTVDNLKAKRSAAQDARNTVGVKWVYSRIKVRPAQRSSDRRIESKINDALMRNPFVERYAITVAVTNGVAELYGTVDTYFEKSRADDAAARVNGVIMVKNHLRVQNDFDPYLYNPYVDESYLPDDNWLHHRPRFPAKSDREIKADIESELFWSPFVDADDVHVAVADGEATLTGTVDSWSEYNAAANNAYQGGAVYVNNQLMLK